MVLVGFEASVAFVNLQIDDAEDAQIVSILIDPTVPEGFDVCNTENMPGVLNLVSNLQVCLLLTCLKRCYIVYS